MKSVGEDKTMYNHVFKKLLDIGDIVGISGTVFKTQVGEISIMAKNIKLLAKSLRPLPLPKKDSEGNIYDAFTDPEKDIDKDMLTSLLIQMSKMFLLKEQR